MAFDTTLDPAATAARFRAVAERMFDDVEALGDAPNTVVPLLAELFEDAAEHLETDPTLVGACETVAAGVECSLFERLLKVADAYAPTETATAISVPA